MGVCVVGQVDLVGKSYKINICEWTVEKPGISVSCESRARAARAIARKAKNTLCFKLILSWITFINIHCFFGWHFKIRHAILALAPALRSFGSHGSGRLIVDFVAEQNEGKILWIPGTGLHQEFISPTFQILEGIRISDIVDLQIFENYNNFHTLPKHSSQLRGRMRHPMIGIVPDLLYPKSYKFIFKEEKPVYKRNLHCDNSVVNRDIFGQEVGTNCCLVLIAETFVDILIHQRSLKLMRFSWIHDFAKDNLSDTRITWKFQYYLNFSSIYQEW